MAKPKKKQKKNRGFDHLGPISRQIKQRATPQQWRRIVKQAHKRGYQVESYLDSSIPDALKARTRKSLRAEAENTIRAAYAPAEKELEQQESRVKALDSKRARDNQYWQQWLESKTAQLNLHSTAANNALRDTIKEITEASGNAVRGLRQEIAQTASQNPGMISNVNESATIANDSESAGKAIAAQTASATSAAARQIQVSEQQQAGYDASNFAFMAALEAKRQSDTWRALAELGDERQKLQLEKAADHAKEVARLLEAEREKTLAVQENKLAAAALDVDMLNIEQRAAEAAEKNRLSRQRLRETMRANREREDIERQRLKDQRAQRDIENSFRQAEIDIKNQRLDLDWYKAKYGGKKGKGKGSGSKGKTPQERFDWGYALVATSSTPGKTGSGNKPGKPGKRYTPEYVQKNRKLVENQLVAKGLSRKMAQAVVAAFIANGRDRFKEPGNYRNWLPTGYPHRNRTRG